MGPSAALRAVSTLGALILLAGTSRATWTVIAVDTRTQEVCISGATCIPNFNLKRNAAVLVVGRGAATAQSMVDQTGLNRRRIWEGLIAGEDPVQILAALAAMDPLHEGRQYGIVDLTHAPLTFTGTGAGLARFGVTGEVGDIKYAIQGNVLTGDVVVTAAEQALLTTPGDLSQRVMAAMEAAASFGGDGRCSCNMSNPTHCGAPPPSFTHSAYTAYIAGSRPGDTDGTCPSSGCANGTYYLDLNFPTTAMGPDPVAQLRVLYDAWRAQQQFFPDTYHSEVVVRADSLVADGRSQTLVRIRPRNIDGTPISAGGLIEVAQTSPGPAVAVASIGGTHGPDLFGFTLTATNQPGVGTWAVTLRYGTKRVRLWPDIELRVDPLAELHAGKDAIAAAESGSVPFTLNLGPAEAGRSYLLLGSSSGTSPGTPFGSIVLPLNDDPFFRITQQHAGSQRFPGTSGALDLDGRAIASFETTPNVLSPWAGQRLDWAAVLLGGQERVTNNVGFQVVP